MGATEELGVPAQGVRADIPAPVCAIGVTPLETGREDKPRCLYGATHPAKGVLLIKRLVILDFIRVIIREDERNRATKL